MQDSNTVMAPQSVRRPDAVALARSLSGPERHAAGGSENPWRAWVKDVELAGLGSGFVWLFSLQPRTRLRESFASRASLSAGGIARYPRGPDPTVPRSSGWPRCERASRVEVSQSGPRSAVARGDRIRVPSQSGADPTWRPDRLSLQPVSAAAHGVRPG